MAKSTKKDPSKDQSKKLDNTTKSPPKFPLLACEVPLDLLNKKDNEVFNDYDFVLLHLYLESPKYREYYLDLRKRNPQRVMMLDNSAYEFYIKGRQFDPELIEKYFEVIQELKPDYYLLPDVLMSSEGTQTLVRMVYDNFSNTIQSLWEIGIKPMGVVQGNSVEEMLDTLCFLDTEMKIQHIAIPFHNSFFKEYGKDFQWDLKCESLNRKSEDNEYVRGRLKFLHQYHHFLKRYQWVHLLGSHNPLEIKWAPSYVKSQDTGYPVKLGLVTNSLELGKEKQKPNIIIDEFLDKKLTKTQREKIIKNIEIYQQCKPLPVT